ncbi:uncharacterized protein LOC123560448 [Mercenaria mercenaria]|uniref:uncharacterized protein LOC123560448 n=1 Tax=Mercenaria mercenaria TaxID=6596 RepID=UPI00234E3E61|nr:uncharacterized protein LOC123560448 [Mercenaria mercenaria]
MELSMCGNIQRCLILLCFIFLSRGEKLIGNENNHSLKKQELKQRMDTPSELKANRRDSPYSIVKRSATNTVDIAMFTDSSAPGKTFTVYVDNTMTRLIIEVKVERSNPVAIVTRPSGIPGPRPNLNGTASTGTVTATIEANISAADYGIWKINKLDSNIWTVKVRGESPLDFSHQFLEGSFIQVPITGEPVQGKTYKTVITVSEYATIQKVDMVLLFVTEKSSPANMMFPTEKGGGKYEVASLKMLDKDFMIGIQGKDKAGNFFRRIAVIKPVALILTVPSFAGSGEKLYENTKLDIPFTVVNKLSKDQDIDVRIQDTQGFAEAPTIISATLKPGENITGKFVITGGLLGVSTDVTITAKPYLGHGKVSHGPSEAWTFTVERNQTTTTSTSSSSSSTTTTTTTTTTTPTSTSTSSTVTTKPTTASSLASSSTKPASTATNATATVSSTSFSSSASASAPAASSVSNSVSPTGSKTTPASKPLATGSTLSSASHSTQATTASSSNQPLGRSKSVTTTVVATTQHTSSSGSVSAQTTKLTGGIVSTTSGSASTKSVPAASGKSSNAPATIKSVSTTNGKSTIPPVSHHAAVSASSAHSQIAGKTTIAAADGDKDETTFSKGEVFGAAIVSGVSAGVLIGVAALVTMGLVFKHSINKGKVTPDEKKQRTLSEHNQLAWT